MAAITDLTTLADTDVADGDWLPVHDLSAGTDKKVAIASLFYNTTGRNITPRAVSILNNGTETLTGLNFGLILVQNNSSGGQALIWLSSSTTTIISQVGSNIGVTAGAASKVNVYVSGGNGVIENKIGSTQTITFLVFAL